MTLSFSIIRNNWSSSQHNILYNFVPAKAGLKFTIRCLNHAFPKIEGFVPKSQHQVVLYTNNPSGAS